MIIFPYALRGKLIVKYPKTITSPHLIDHSKTLTKSFSYMQISIFPHQNPPFLGPAGKPIKLIVIGICLAITAAAQRNISGCRYNCEFCEMKLTWKTYSVVLFYPFYDIYSLTYSSIANVKESLIYIIITLKTATQHLKVSFALTDLCIQ